MGPIYIETHYTSKYLQYAQICVTLKLIKYRINFFLDEDFIHQLYYLIPAVYIIVQISVT